MNYVPRAGEWFNDAVTNARLAAAIAKVPVATFEFNGRDYEVAVGSERVVCITDGEVFNVRGTNGLQSGRERLTT